MSFLSKADAIANPHKLFVFGDNLARKGYGGQAKEMRGCLNAVGLPTKRIPATDTTAYLQDKDFEKFKQELDGELAILEAHLSAGGTVVFPKAGVGTGLAKLQTKSPKCWNYLCTELHKLGINNVQLKIISGGQTGADEGGLEAAYLEDIPTGGWMPKNCLTEKGSNYALAKKYGLSEDSSSGYKSRTHKNAAAADVTLWFGKTDSPGYFCTRNGCTIADRPLVVVTDKPAKDIAELIRSNHYSIINIAGNRESSNPGLYNYVVKTMRDVINQLR